MIGKRILAVLAALGLGACFWNGEEPDHSHVTQLGKTAYGDSTAFASTLSAAPLHQGRGFVAVWQSQDKGPPLLGNLAIAETDSVGNTVSAWNIMGRESIGCQGPRVAGLPGGGYVIAWYSRGPSAIEGNAYFQIAGNGHENGDPVRLDFPGLRYVYSVSVAAMQDTGFVLAIAGYDSTYETSVRVQRYDASGKPSGPLRRILSGRMTGKPEIIDLRNGGWMLAWKTVNQTGYFMEWQPFSGNGEPAGEARKVAVGDWDPDIRMRRFPGGRIYLDAGEMVKRMFMDDQGAPDPKYDSLPRYLHNLVADSSRGRLYGLDYEKITALDAEARPLGSRQIAAFDALHHKQLFLNAQGNLVLFFVNYTYVAPEKQLALAQSIVMKPF